MVEQIIEWNADVEFYKELIDTFEFSTCLGRIFDGVWYLKVKYDHLDLNPYLLFYLNVHENVDERRVEVTIESPNSMSQRRLFHFDSKNKQFLIGSLPLCVPLKIILKFTKMTMQEKQNLMISEKLALSAEIARQKIQNSIIPETRLNAQINSEEIQKSIIPDTSSLKAQIASEESDLSYIKELAEDLQAMTFRENLSDVTVLCNLASFKVHKVILCARSPVFSAMFASEMQEKATDTVTMDDMDPEAVRSMIQFIYSGQIHINSVAEATRLLDLSEQYQIQSLKAGLIEYFKSNLSLQNAIKILELADLYDQNLKQDVIKFISTHFDTLKQEKNWKDLRSTKPALAFEVYDNMN